MNDFLDSFGRIWGGGYYEGDPADPVGRSTYGVFGYQSTLYVTYLTCIKPFVRPGMTCLEIGPGRGAWTKLIADMGPAMVHAVDVVDPHYAGFSDYVGKRENVRHVVTTDFELSEIEDRSVDHFFSFGVFCHLKPEMCVAYFNSLARKMTPGAHGFVQIADIEKYNRAHAEWRRHSVWWGLAGRRHMLIRRAIELTVKLWPQKIVPRIADDPHASFPGAWFHLGVARAVEALEMAGFSVLESDMEINQRDPILHFVKR